MLRRLAALAASIFWVLSAPAFALDAGSARDFVDGLAQRVLAVVKDGASSKESKIAAIEQLFSDKVDIDFVARFALGKYWREASAQQQTAYIAAYKPFILKNYAGRLARYSGQTYTLKNPRLEGDAAFVTMNIQDPNSGQDVTVDYRVGERGHGQYKILDIVVEGVSLLSTQRSEFAAIVDQKGIDGLIEALQQQIARKS